MKILHKLLRVFKDRSGATVVEYCIIAGIISVVIVGGASVMGSKTNSSFTKLNTEGFAS
jgi:pilus assembly protein Flp/PilA